MEDGDITPYFWIASEIILGVSIGQKCKLLAVGRREGGGLSCSFR